MRAWPANTAPTITTQHNCWRTEAAMAAGRLGGWAAFLLGFLTVRPATQFQDEAGAAAWRGLDGDLTAVRLDDARNDVQSQTTAQRAAIASPEPLQDEMVFSLGNSRSLVGNSRKPIAGDVDRDHTPWRAVSQPVFDKIAQRAKERLSLAVHPDGRLADIHRHLFAR